MNYNFMNYWQWLNKGSGGKPGYRRIINIWLLVHLSVGIIMALIVPVDLTSTANTVLLPLAGIFIGLSFAWAGQSQALMESREIEKLAEYHEGGFEEYVFIYQTAILTIMITLVLWCLAGLQVFDKTWPTSSDSVWYIVIKIVLFTFSSITLRECWHVVMGTQWMLLIKNKIKKSIGNSKRDI